MPVRLFIRVCLLLSLAACGQVDPPVAGDSHARKSEIAASAGQWDIDGLTHAVLALGPGVDSEEAARAARISYERTEELRIAYGISSPPLIHNMKVNMGIKSRGLCWHWADDMQERLAAENFQTLQLHRAIANHDVLFRIEHSTVIISAKGDDMTAGIVIDPWRMGGELFWSRTLEDDRYSWVPRTEVFEYKRRRIAAALAYKPS